MYLVKEENKKSLVERAIEEHNINTPLLEGREKVNPFDELEIIEKIDFKDVDKYNNIHVCLCSQEPHIILMTSFLYSYPIIILYLM